MADEKLLQLLLTRFQSRENTALGVATASASASLVFLGLIYEKTVTLYYEFLIIGILFPAIGFVYNEITNRGIHKEEHSIIRKIIDKESSDFTNKIDIIINKKNLRKRLLFLRFLSLSPILGWLLTLQSQMSLSENNHILYDVTIFIIIIAIAVIITCSDKIDK
jgi:hypothetical protein